MRVRGGLRARPWRTCLCINDHTSVNKIIGDERRKSQQRRGRKAAGIANARRRPYSLAVRLRQPVNEIRLRSKRRVLAFVELLEHFAVAQAKVAREINHLHLTRQARRNLNRLPMRKWEENEIKIRQAIQVFRRNSETKISQSVQILMHIADGFASLLIRRDECDLNLRVHQQQAQKFRAAVARTTEDSDKHSYDYEKCSILIERLKRRLQDMAWRYLLWKDTFYAMNEISLKWRIKAPKD